MALADSGRAIGATTRLLREHLTRLGHEVSINHPELAASAGSDPKLNLFLFEVSFDASLRNVALADDQPPPLWLCLHYLLTAYDEGAVSDSMAAHELLGRGLGALQELNFLRLDAMLDANIRQALENNPEPLKVTFDETSSELLSRLMQGPDERYRLSVAFQVRPVMIAPAEPPAFAGIVGIDTTQAPPAVIGLAGRALSVLASLGPRPEALSQAAVEPGAEFELSGEDLQLAGLECRLGGVALAIVAQRPERLRLRADGEIPAGAGAGPIAAGGTLSAGLQTLDVGIVLPGGRWRSGGLLSLVLLPVVETVTVVAGTLSVSGTLLGTWNDDILIALVQDGRIARLLEPGLPPPAIPPAGSIVPGPAQNSLSVTAFAAGLPAGEYRVVVRVNGQQARRTPAVLLP